MTAYRAWCTRPDHQHHVSSTLRSALFHCGYALLLKKQTPDSETAVRSLSPEQLTQDTRKYIRGPRGQAAASCGKLLSDVGPIKDCCEYVLHSTVHPGAGPTGEPRRGPSSKSTYYVHSTYSVQSRYPDSREKFLRSWRPSAAKRQGMSLTDRPVQIHKTRARIGLTARLQASRGSCPLRPWLRPSLSLHDYCVSYSTLDHRARD